VPAILADTRRRLEPLPGAVAAAFDELAEELATGALRPLRGGGPDRPLWDRAVAPHAGRSWLDVPWYFAEAYFYRRILEATGYFEDGPLGGQDPYAAAKRAELAPGEGPARCAAALAATPDAGPGARPGRLRARLHASLWGNRADLSYNVAAALGAHAGDARDLLVDDADRVAERLAGDPPRRIALVADNAGTELLMDLALVAALLEDDRVEAIELHLKAQPFFVSDAMPADVEIHLAALEAAGGLAAGLAGDLRGAQEAGRLLLRTHPFYTSSLHYPELPADLRAALGAQDLVLAKGDANYRRLCSDARWPRETPFADVVAYFPAPLVALRTCKAELVVGLPAGLAARLDAEAPGWMVDGRRGLIQARPRAGGAAS
jgi:hypothetical protein